MGSGEKSDLGAFAMIAALLAAFFTVAVYSAGSDVEGGPGEFFGCGLVVYAAAAFVVAFALLALLAFVSRSLKERRWRHDRRHALELIVVLAAMAWAGATLAVWGARRVGASRAYGAEDRSVLASYGRLALERRDGVLAKALVRNTSCPAAVLAQLADADWPELLEWDNGAFPVNRRPVLYLVARHPNTPPEALERLANRNAGLAVEVARNPTVDAALLERIARQEHRNVQIAVAASTRAPGPLLSRLSRSPDWQVRAAAARNESTGAEELTVLARDSELGVRRGLLTNRQLPREALAALASDQNTSIAYLARKRLERKAPD